MGRDGKHGRSFSIWSRYWTSNSALSSSDAISFELRKSKIIKCTKYINVCQICPMTLKCNGAIQVKYKKYKRKYRKLLILNLTTKLDYWRSFKYNIWKLTSQTNSLWLADCWSIKKASIDKNINTWQTRRTCNIDGISILEQSKL